ncbi:HU family DNA-binding protein [Streptomyces sp. NBC_00838]|uniref:HU family DNA-binding protein n=1 Tax=Streptomyces sp. NBC_00838 TaxID=2903680 RepID=UPI003868DFE1|nr:HU family DNA-binding protein [Streptomyces sp. NBC_00838]
METMKKRRVSKREFISRVATRSELPIRVVNKVYRSLLGELTDAVNGGEIVVLTSFGRFYRQDPQGAQGALRQEQRR